MGIPAYICGCDGTILSIVHKDAAYKAVIEGGLFSICDSSWVPIYLKWIYGINREQYCGSQILMDVISLKKYRHIFLGATPQVLDGLKSFLRRVDKSIDAMCFMALPFCEVDEFDYPAIAQMIERDGAQIVWVSLGAPKQEIFMSRLQPYLKNGVMIAVGAAFKYFSGVDEKRAPQWMIRCHLEFIHRLFCNPKKQFKRCMGIVTTMPGLLADEWKRKREKMNA